MVRNNHRATYDKPKIELEKVFIEYHHKQVLDIEANQQRKNVV